MCSVFGQPAESDEGVYTTLVLHSVSGHTHYLTGCSKHLRICHTVAYRLQRPQVARFDNSELATGKAGPNAFSLRPSLSMRSSSSLSARTSSSQRSGVLI